MYAFFWYTCKEATYIFAGCLFACMSVCLLFLVYAAEVQYYFAVIVWQCLEMVVCSEHYYNVSLLVAPAFLCSLIYPRHQPLNP